MYTRKAVNTSLAQESHVWKHLAKKTALIYSHWKIRNNYIPIERFISRATDQKKPYTRDRRACYLRGPSTASLTSIPMAGREILLLLLLLLVAGPRIVLGVHRCFSNTCSSSGVCIRVCEPNEHHCHIEFSLNYFFQLDPTDMGCGRSANLNTFAPISCEGDLCNVVNGVTNDIQPVLEIPLNLPKDPPPQPREGRGIQYTYYQKLQTNHRIVIVHVLYLHVQINSCPGPH